MLCTAPLSMSNMESRITDGYVVLPTGNCTGTLKVYNIANGTNMPHGGLSDTDYQRSGSHRGKLAHIHVFDELLKSRKLRASNMPTCSTPGWSYVLCCSRLDITYVRFPMGTALQYCRNLINLCQKTIQNFHYSFAIM